ncbi:MAG: hypothetical protein DSY80_09025 [Desulfocapsa sp.]|nr:MAG: hypothetical protein DSY80_09025 [Desulfocapsa sp.]
MKFKQDLDDKRKSIRIDYTVPVRITCLATDRMVKGTLINLSVNGMLVDLKDDASRVAVDFKGDCMVQVIIPGKGSRLVVDELKATLTRIEETLVALSFKEPLEWFLLFNVYRGKQIHRE